MKRFWIIASRPLKRRRLFSIWLLLTGFTSLWLAIIEMMRAHGNPQARLTALALNEVIMLAALTLPISSALFATRIVHTHSDNHMSEKWEILGYSPRQQFLLNSLITTVLTALLALVNLGTALGFAKFFQLRSETHLSTIAVLVLLALIAGSFSNSFFQTMLATRFEQQGVTICISSVSALLTSALPFFGLKWLSWLTPWSITNAANPIAQPQLQKLGAPVVLEPNLLILAGLAFLITFFWTGTVTLLVTVGSKK